MLNRPSEFSLDSLAASRYILTLFCEKRSKSIEKVGFFWRSTPLFTEEWRWMSRGGTVSVLRINISKLSEGTHHHSLAATAEEVGLDPRFKKELQVEATLEKTSRQLYMRVEVKAGGVFTCDRCLEEFEQDVTSEYGVMFVSDQNAVPVDGDEVQVLAPDSTHVDLADDVRQFVLLDLPRKMLCREDCAGLCPTCGSNLNQGKCECKQEESDSRWSELQKILKN
jgi:uncharacterized protein